MQPFKLHLNLVSRVQNQGASQVRNGVSHTGVQPLHHLDYWSNTIENPDTNNKIRTMERFIEYVVIHYKIVLAPFYFFFFSEKCRSATLYSQTSLPQMYTSSIVCDHKSAQDKLTASISRTMQLSQKTIHPPWYFPFFLPKGCTPTADSCSGIKYSGPIAIFLMTSYASPDNISLTEKDKQCRLELQRYRRETVTKIDRIYKYRI